MPKPPFQRRFVAELSRRLREPRRTLHLLAGPRQVGKTTGVLQALEGRGRSHFASADDAGNPDAAWVATQWELGRRAAQDKSGVLVLDEIQRVPDWSRVVKGLWDQDSRHGRDLQVVLLGSSALLLARSSSESLAGRFEPLPVSHWDLTEEAQAFGWGLEEHLLHGGYPGPAGLIKDPVRWKAQVNQALVEPALNQDVLQGAAIEKPALLRGLFQAACDHAAQVVSYNKLLGQLTDRGNVTILSHYQTLLERAWLVLGLQKYSGSTERKRASSPKWLPLAPALVTARADQSWDAWSRPGQARGQLVECAVGAHLARQCRQQGWSLTYWREGNDEVDYVVKAPGRLWAIEVKSGRARSAHGLAAFMKAHPKATPVVIEGPGLERFLREPLD